MKLIIKTISLSEKSSQGKTYFVQLPNYFDSDLTNQLIEDVSINCLHREKVVEYMLMGDSFITNDERKQLDIHGKIVNPPVALNYNNLSNFLKSAKKSSPSWTSD